jgi:hypothetical protein
MLSIDLKHLNDVCDALDGLSVLKEDRGRAMGVVSCWRHGAIMKLASARVVDCLQQAGVPTEVGNIDASDCDPSNSRAIRAKFDDQPKVSKAIDSLQKNFRFSILQHFTACTNLPQSLAVLDALAKDSLSNMKKVVVAVLCFLGEVQASNVSILASITPDWRSQFGESTTDELKDPQKAVAAILNFKDRPSLFPWVAAIDAVDHLYTSIFSLTAECSITHDAKLTDTVASFTTGSDFANKKSLVVGDAKTTVGCAGYSVSVQGSEVFIRCRVHFGNS